MNWKSGCGKIKNIFSFDIFKFNDYNYYKDKIKLQLLNKMESVYLETTIPSYLTSRQSRDIII
ncbi:hypothetical protein KAH27_00435, partial [bacterium]|nr:hypothetical protein [bacterium]